MHWLQCFHDISLIKQEAEDRTSKLKTKFFRLFSLIISWIKFSLLFCCEIFCGNRHFGFGAKFIWMALTAMFSRDFYYRIGTKSPIKTKIKFFWLFCCKFFWGNRHFGFGAKFIWMALTALFSRDFFYKIGSKSQIKTKIKFFLLFCCEIFPGNHHCHLV